MYDPLEQPGAAYLETRYLAEYREGMQQARLANAKLEALHEAVPPEDW